MSIDEIKVHVPWFSGLSIYIFAKTHALATESSEARARKVNAHSPWSLHPTMWARTSESVGLGCLGL